MNTVGRNTKQTSLLSFSVDRRAKLFDNQVLITGSGRLELPVAQYLSALGVSTLGLVENDAMKLHNLQPQVSYIEVVIKKFKFFIAGTKLSAQNLETHIKFFKTFLISDNATDSIQDVDLVIDAAENFTTRYLINDACVLPNKSFNSGVVCGFEDKISVFNYRNGPTYRCAFPDIPQAEETPGGDETAVLGVLPETMGTLHAFEVVTGITGVGEVLSEKLLLFDGLTQKTRKSTFDSVLKSKQISKLQNSYGFQDCTVYLVSAEVSVSIHNTKKTQVIDVRNPDELKNLNVPDAENIPINKLEVSLVLIGFEKPVYLICKAGRRSGVALEKLSVLKPKAMVYPILGGMNKMTRVCH